MTKNYQAVKTKVHKKISIKTMKSIIKFVSEKSPSLWGIKKTRGFLEKSIYLAIYKDLSNKGYDCLSLKTKGWHNINKKSLRHNTQKLRKYLGEWGKEQIQLGEPQDWTAATRGINIFPQFQNIVFWWDSMDVPLTNKKGINKKHSSWSYKLNRWGQRFMILADAHRRVRKIWGGYSPKVFDGDFILLTKDWIEEKLSGVASIGDNHFKSGAKILRSHVLYAPMKKPPNTKKTTYKGLKSETKSQKIERRALKAIRSRIESPFGEIKNKFISLSKPFGESKKQQSYVVEFAFGVHNSLLK